MSKKSKGTNPINVHQVTNQIVSLFNQNPSNSFTYSTITKRIALRKNNRPEIQSSVQFILDTLKFDETIKEVSKGIYRLNQDNVKHEIGVLDTMPSGNGFVSVIGLDKDVFISANKINGAYKGDTVKIIVTPQRGKGRIEGEIVEIIKRAKDTFVGVIEIGKYNASLVSVNKNVPDIFIPLPKINGAKNGQKVVVKIVNWGNNSHKLEAEVTTVLGNPGDNETEMHAILAEYELPYKFPKEVEKEAEKISEIITEEEIKKRRDFRKTTTFTIDPVDAKDFDDALSFKKLPNGHYEIGIHIADVAHYVIPGSILDDEAYTRATSVYLVDRVVPMLPEKLSNKVCSLRPNEEKLCFAAVFELDEEGNIFNEWYGRTIINSCRRFTYEEAQQVLETGEGDLKEELLTMNGIAKKMRAVRYKKGSISFDTREVKFHIDKDGKPTGVYFKVAKDSNNLIEDFMLLANRKVAELISGAIEKVKEKEKANAFVYRVHDSPNEDKLLAFSKFAKKFGYKVKTTGHLEIAKSLNVMLDEVKGKKEQNLMQTLAVRSMAKAVYTTKNIGHYGLAFEHYTHFTSPIRRYPDVLVHRLLADYLSDSESKPKIKQVADKLLKRTVTYNSAILEPMCKHASDREKLAADAERSSIKYKQVEFMQDKVGNIYKALISGVTEFGMFAEIEENLCEGFVRLSNIKSDFFEFDADNYCVTGRRTKKVYRIGDEVYIKVLKANLVKKQLDFELESPDFII